MLWAVGHSKIASIGAGRKCNLLLICLVSLVWADKLTDILGVVHFIKIFYPSFQYDTNGRKADFFFSAR